MTGQLQVLLGYSSSLAGAVFLSMIVFSLPLVSIAHKLCEANDARFVASLNLLGFVPHDVLDRDFRRSKLF